jgi:hypothetical protein
LIKTKPVAITTAAEKMPFEVTPFFPFLTRLGAPAPEKTAPVPEKTATAPTGQQDGLWLLAVGCQEWISHTTVNGTPLLNFDGFAPASQWEELSTAPVSRASRSNAEEARRPVARALRSGRPRSNSAPSFNSAGAV